MLFIIVVWGVVIVENMHWIFMYSLYDDEGLLAESFLEGNNELILSKNIELLHDETKNYTLIIWLKENGENQNKEMRKDLIGQIRVDASQKID